MPFVIINPTKKKKKLTRNRKGGISQVDTAVERRCRAKKWEALSDFEHQGD